MIKVYFLKSEHLDSLPPRNTSVVEQGFADGKYELVAEVDADDLDDAWTMLQNGVTSPSWGREPPPQVKPVIGTVTSPRGQILGNRSSMVGDIFEHNGVFNVVDMIGFKVLAINTAPVSDEPK